MTLIHSYTHTLIYSYTIPYIRYETFMWSGEMKEERESGGMTPPSIGIEGYRGVHRGT